MAKRIWNNNCSCVFLITSFGPIDEEESFSMDIVLQVLLLWNSGFRMMRLYKDKKEKIIMKKSKRDLECTSINNVSSFNTYYTLRRV